MADFRKTPVLVASSLLALAFSGCGDLDSDSLPNEPAEVEKDDEADAPMTQLRGALLDVDGAPVANAEVRLAVGSVPVTEPVMTDAEGNYTLAFPTAEAKWAWSRGQEVTVLFNTPKRDEGAPGAEGDLIHLLPATLDELVDAELVVENAELEADTAYVPRQGQGFKITDDLVTNGGTLTWTTSDSQYGDNFSVSLIIEPGSLHRGEDAQEEITLTLIEQALAPMAIPAEGFGPLWTIQPRDVVFDPPARIRIEGEEFAMMGPSDMATGDVTELYGASLETGWKLFGDIQLVERTEDGRVVMETTEGVVSHGAWGHVFNNTPNDYGMLVECFDRDSLERVQCAVLNDNTYWYQDPDDYYNWNITNTCEDPDFVPPDGVGGGYDSGFLSCGQWDYGTSSHDGNQMVYATDGETRCRSCGGANSKTVVAMTARNVGTSSEPIFGGVTAFPLCPEETTIRDMDALWAILYTRLGVNWGMGDILPFEDATIAEELQVELTWRNFNKSVQIYLPQPVNCATGG